MITVTGPTLFDIRVQLRMKELEEGKITGKTYRLYENGDEVVIHLEPIYKNKNILIVYDKEEER